MGYYMSKIEGGEPSQYIGSITMMSLADNGAFDSDVSTELEELANSNENIMAIVEKSGIQHFLNISKSGNCNGKYISQVIESVEKNFMEGFIIRH